MTRKDFQELAGIRLVEARILFKNGLYSGAFYLAGYAVECALKACIAKRVRRYDFPPREARDYYTHNLEKLRDLAGLSKNEQSAGLRANWVLVSQWSEESRYRLHEKADAERLLRAIDDRKEGVLQWIRKSW